MEIIGVRAGQKNTRAIRGMLLPPSTQKGYISSRDVLR